MHAVIKLFSAILTTAYLLLIGSNAMAEDIRQRPVPDPGKKLQEFGYTATIASQMLSGARDDLWARVPSRGWTNDTYALKNRMYTALGGSGFDDALANVVINVCKAHARDPRHCVIYMSAVSCAESSCGASWKAASIQNNIFGLNIPGQTFSSRTAAVKDWVVRYNNKWFTANEGYFYSYCQATYYCGVGKDYDVYFFYSDNAAKPSTSRYCMSEIQPNGSKIDGYCPNGYRNAKSAYLNVR